MVEVLVVAEVILAVHVVVMDVEVVELSMSDWSVPFSSGEKKFVAGKCLQTHLKPPWNRTFKFYNKYAMHMLCRYAWHSDPLKFSIPQQENALRSFDPYVISENMPPIHHTDLSPQVTPILSRLWGYGHVDQCLGHFKWLVSKPKPSPQLPWCSVWLGTEVAAMATLSTASCLSIATAHGWIYELSSFKPCQTCGFQTFREDCLPTTCVWNTWKSVRALPNLFGHFYSSHFQ